MNSSSEKLQFLSDEIHYYGIEPSEDIHFPYTDIQNLVVHFHGVKNDGLPNPSFISWEADGQLFQYCISVNSEYPKSQLLKVLKLFYAKKIQVREVNAENKEMRLLQVSENQMTKQEESKYLNLIEDIGKEENGSSDILAQ